MLERARDELRSTIRTYQQLYLSSLKFGVRKALLGLNEEKYLKRSIENFEKQNQSLEEEIKQIEFQINNLEDNQNNDFKSIEMEFQSQTESVQKENLDLKKILKQKFSLTDIHNSNK